MANKKVAKKVVIEHKQGDRHAVNDVFCEVRFINAGTGFLFPIVDDPEDREVRTHVAYGRIDETGKVTRI